MDNFIYAVTLIAAVACGMIAGVFFAFSTFVMKALARLPAREGIVAMQSINIAAVKSAFLGSFLGTAASCLLVVLLALVRRGEPSAALLLAGGLAYLIGTFFVTMVFNVPMNNALAALEPTAADSGARWMSYQTNWTAWNHVRTLSSLAATTLLILAADRL